MKRVSKLIKESRERAGISGEAVSCYVQKNPFWCYQLEAQKCKPHRKELRKVADFLEIDYHTILVAYLADVHEWLSESLFANNDVI